MWFYSFEENGDFRIKLIIAIFGGFDSRKYGFTVLAPNVNNGLAENEILARKCSQRYAVLLCWPKM